MSCYYCCYFPYTFRYYTCCCYLSRCWSLYNALGVANDWVITGGEGREGKGERRAGGKDGGTGTPEGAEEKKGREGGSDD